MDMAGNLWEWCLNAYSEPEQPKAVRINKKSGARVVRGGSLGQRRSGWLEFIIRLRLFSGGRFLFSWFSSRPSH